MSKPSPGTTAVVLASRHAPRSLLSAPLHLHPCLRSHLSPCLPQHRCRANPSPACATDTTPCGSTVWMLSPHIRTSPPRTASMDGCHRALLSKTTAPPTTSFFRAHADRREAVTILDRPCFLHKFSGSSVLTIVGSNLASSDRLGLCIRMTCFVDTYFFLSRSIRNTKMKKYEGHN